MGTTKAIEIQVKSLQEPNVNKSSLHYRFASWSIKNPMVTYASLGVLVVALLAGGGMIFGKKNHAIAQKANASVNVSTNTPASDMQRAGWSILGESNSDNMRCIRYRRDSNYTRMTSCYTMVKGEWVFNQSY